MPVSSYLPHLIYSVALTSLSFHLLFHRKQVELDRAHLTAQTSILESLAQQLRSGQNISDTEVERLSRLAKTHAEGSVETASANKEKIGWGDVFLGRAREGGSEKEQETKALNTGKCYLHPAHTF